MAERLEEPEAATEQALDQASPAAVALALGRTIEGRQGPRRRGDRLPARSRRRLIDLQTEHLHEQRELQTSRLRWGRFSDRMKAAIQVMTALVGLAVVAAVGAMAWRAHEDHGLRIEAFSVPPDLAQTGLTGQVVASQLLDQLAELQAKTVTGRPASTYANDWGGDIKVEIPETGVSIGELNRYLREWLGGETRITGEVVRTAAGLAVTARAGADPGATFQGAETDIDKLTQQAAEAIYAQTQPYRYAVYLASSGRQAEALAAFAGWRAGARRGPALGLCRLVVGPAPARRLRGRGQGGARRPAAGAAALQTPAPLNNLSSRGERAQPFRRARLWRGRCATRSTGRAAASTGCRKTLPCEHRGRHRRSPWGLSVPQSRLCSTAPGPRDRRARGCRPVTSLLVRGLISDHDVSAGLRLSIPASAGVLSGLGLLGVTDADRMRAAWRWRTGRSGGNRRQVSRSWRADPRHAR